ncbi:TPA: hypothetical protein N3G98_000936 [Salmonella enterica subsp. enterica serovar Denver]|nr:hypothetical protein [Salmonella enterica subsp. enterica serovar Denver]ECD5429466.1 hypothetical protein [Salmonella enterica subsp. enterica serovar Denver]HCM3790864.1 hypothetical protein [Salmonella enterica subsp. enterica serovar Denver]
MNKETLRHFISETNKVKRMLHLAKKRLNEGRYKDAEEHLRGEALMLNKLAAELRDQIELRDSNT